MYQLGGMYLFGSGRGTYSEVAERYRLGTARYHIGYGVVKEIAPMASTCNNHPAVCLCQACAPKRQRFMAQHRAEQERLSAAQHQDEAAHRAAAWRRNRAEARARLLA